MRELTYFGPRRVDWRSVPEPTLHGPSEALVRPVIASRCDGDNLPHPNTAVLFSLRHPKKVHLLYINVLCKGRKSLADSRAGEVCHLTEALCQALFSPK